MEVDNAPQRKLELSRSKFLDPDINFMEKYKEDIELLFLTFKNEKQKINKNELINLINESETKENCSVLCHKLKMVEKAELDFNEFSNLFITDPKNVSKYVNFKEEHLKYAYCLFTGDQIKSIGKEQLTQIAEKYGIDLNEKDKEMMLEYIGMSKNYVNFEELKNAIVLNEFD